MSSLIMDENEAWECESCRTKPGTPVLCQSCLHNRSLISYLKGKLKDYDKMEIMAMFHRLWTKAVGTEGYNKQEWLNFEKALHKEVFK